MTCPNKAHWKLMQNGHFITRHKFSVRWDEMNCHVQCQYCNENLSGNLKVYRVFMVQTYGQEAVDDLVRLSHQTDKMTVQQIELLTDIYTEKVKKLQ